MFYKYFKESMSNECQMFVEILKRNSDIVNADTILVLVSNLLLDGVFADFDCIVEYLNSLRCESNSKTINTIVLAISYVHNKPILKLNEIKPSEVDYVYAYNLCCLYEDNIAKIQLLAGFGFSYEAIESSLKMNNVDLAVECATKSTENQKEMYTMIIKHVITTKDKEKLNRLIKEHSDLIQIEDIIPLVGDDLNIVENVKDEIFYSIDKSMIKIENMKKEIKKTIQSQKTTINKIKERRKEYIIIENNEKCAKCSKRLFIKQVASFHCGHSLHVDCLFSETKSKLSAKNNKRLRELLSLQGEMEKTVFQFNNSNTPDDSRSRLVEIIEKIETLLIQQCIYCGDDIAHNIDLPVFEGLNANSLYHRDDWDA